MLFKSLGLILQTVLNRLTVGEGTYKKVYNSDSGIRLSCQENFHT